MCDYTDKVIKSLEPEKIKLMKLWNKNFTKPYTEDEFKSLIELSKLVDELWKKQIEARHELEAATITALDVYGHKDTRSDCGQSIREKDKFLRSTYKSEHAQNAGAYARLKFAMDYWCALWFWPISQAELLPSRSEFLFEMDLILRGTMQTNNPQKQLSFISDEEDKVMIQDVDLDQLCELFPRLALVRKIANDNKFMHWELEFADVFADKGGFDLVIGNPPWVLLGWNEQNLLSDSNPMFAVKKLTATQTAKQRNDSLSNSSIYSLYFKEYESLIGQQNFLGAIENYPDLTGIKANLFKCFLPQAWQFGSVTGVSAFVHPDGVYDDPKGGLLREKLYPKLRYHFQFENELNLFEGTNDHGRMRFALNIYSNTISSSFDTISNLFHPSTVDECYDETITGNVPGIKDEEGNWNTNGHPQRIIKVGQKELELFANLFDGNDEWEKARLPMLHAETFINILSIFASQNKHLEDIEGVYSTILLDETQAQLNGVIVRKEHFPESCLDLIYSGTHIGIANSLFKSSRKICQANSHFDPIDLSSIPSDYLQRCNYSPSGSESDFSSKIPEVEGKKYHAYSKLIARRMLNQSGERTLIPAITPPFTTCINTLTSIIFINQIDLALTEGLFSSLPYDAYIKLLGRNDFYFETAKTMPIPESVVNKSIIARTVMLNCLSDYYLDLWSQCFLDEFSKQTWSKSDSRLDNKRFSTLTSEWTWDTPLRTDYERRQALVEIDVLTAMALGMTLEQLKTIYRIQFPVLQQYEANTWYDANGRIVFTTNRSLVGVGFDRKAWEGNVKGAPAGKVFTREIEDDTLPGGPDKRTIEYVAPFDKCDREQDYETAWKFFEEKYGK